MTQLEDHKILEFLRPIYGLADVGYYWHGNFLRHLKEYLGMAETANHRSFHFNLVQNKLQGLIATHVDNTFSGGNRRFQEDTLETAHHFDAKSRKLG